MQAHYRDLSKQELSYPSRRPVISGTSTKNEVKLSELFTLSFMPMVRSVQRWWLERAERHYLICADIEQQRAREAQMNVAYYQKRAALARASLH
jgi:heme exporter protein D